MMPDMGIASGFNTREESIPLPEKILSLNWGLVLLITLISGAGVLALYSAAGADFSPWADKHLLRYSITLLMALLIALIDIRFWARLSYVAYGGALALLILVEVMGFVGMGAQRWINLGFIQLQPSELMKIGLVLALARYCHSASGEEVKRFRFLVIPILITAVPFALVLIQPDLGTALMLMIMAVTMLFLVGVQWWKFAIAGVLAVMAIPVGWLFLHDYQKQRVLTFLNPERDPLGAGYHIIQSKIALGSGGISGKGFLQGTQSHLNFLPEKQTDFIFTLLAEEWGLTGGLVLLGLFGCIFLYGMMIALRSRHSFGRYLAMGLTINFSLYVIINIAMVMGLMPVVGVPLPLVSYGGTAMLSTMIGFGLILSVYIHRDIKVRRYL